MCVLALGAYMSHHKCGVREQLSQIVLLFVLWNPEIEQTEHRFSGLDASVFTAESSHRY